MPKNDEKMKVDVWADLMCPFCYLGKRRFEAALRKFPDKGKIEVVWHSFQLNPGIRYVPGRDLYDYVAEIKGQSRGWSVKFHAMLAAEARKAGLRYDFDKVVVNNTFDAHRLVQFAKKRGLGEVAEERLFRAYFTEGRDIGDRGTLVALGKDAGLDPAEVKKMLASGGFAAAVRHDIGEAKKLMIDGVPFFLMNRAHAVIGAQPPVLFLKALKTSFSEWKKKKH
jgi:predicted DsbA family dithiol-disulfide isomerase